MWVQSEAFKLWLHWWPLMQGALCFVVFDAPATPFLAAATQGELPAPPQAVLAALVECALAELSPARADMLKEPAQGQFEIRGEGSATSRGHSVDFEGHREQSRQGIEEECLRAFQLVDGYGSNTRGT